MTTTIPLWTWAIAVGALAACVLLGAWLARMGAARDRRDVMDAIERMERGLREDMGRDSSAARHDARAGLDAFSGSFGTQMQNLMQLNDARMAELRNVLDARLHSLQNDNAERLEAMRRTVDERLQSTLEKRLGESFRLVSDRLDAVHRGLGEMQTLAAGVGDLKRVLTNVKSRGTWGEVQLARLLEDTMTPAQYGQNVKPLPGSDAIVEFAIRLPGPQQDRPVWLPIDAKFPKEEFERLVAAQDGGDLAAQKLATAALARAVETQAKMIGSKYVAPPHTTDFAIMFVPTEGLFAEIVRHPGLLDRLQALRVNVAGPANLAAMLNSLQMGFRTLAIEQRSAEVWQVLRAVKTEFGKFGEALAAVKKSLDTASTRIGSTEVRTRAMLRNLSAVEALGSSDPDSALPQHPDFASQQRPES